MYVGCFVCYEVQRMNTCCIRIPNCTKFNQDHHPSVMLSYDNRCRQTIEREFKGKQEVEVGSVLENRGVAPNRSLEILTNQKK